MATALPLNWVDNNCSYACKWVGSHQLFPRLQAILWFSACSTCKAEVMGWGVVVQRPVFIWLKVIFCFLTPSSSGRPFNWLPLSIVWAGNAWLVMACTRTSSRSESCTQPSFLANRVAEWEALHRDYDWCSHANPTPPLIGGNLTPPTLPLDQPANDRVLSDYGQNWRQPHSPRCRQCGVLGGFVPQTRWREGAMQREWKVSWSAWTFSRYSLLLYLVLVDLQLAYGKSDPHYSSYSRFALCSIILCTTLENVYLNWQPRLWRFALPCNGYDLPAGRYALKSIVDQNG